MSEFKQYRRTGLSEMRDPTPSDYAPHEDARTDGPAISVSESDRAEWDTTRGGKVARNPKNHADLWYVSRAYFEENLEPV